MLWGTGLILTFPKEQDLVWVSAGGTAGLRITAATMGIAWLANMVVIGIVPWEAAGAAGAAVGQGEADTT